MQKKDVNIRYIAEKCGVSTATVSRVLNDGANVAENTRQKVLDALEQYGYNTMKSFSPRVKKIGVIMRLNNPDYNTGILHYVTEYFYERGIQVISSHADKDFSRVPEALETLYDAGVSGILLIRCPYLQLKDHIKKKIPHVWLDCNDKAEDTENICCTQSDHYASGQMAALELIKHGCRKPIVINGAERTHRTDDRNNGFILEYKKQGIGIEDDCFIYLPGFKDTFSETQEIVKYLLTKGFDFDSIFAISDWRALGAYNGVKSMGLNVPEDIKLIGFDGISLASSSLLNITCVQQNIEQLADSVCTQLDTLLKGESVVKKHVVVPTGILAGQTL